MSNLDLANSARKTLERFVHEINPKIEELFDDEIAKVEISNPKEMKLVKQMLEHSREYLLRPQKRLRPSLVYYGFKFGEGKVDERIWKVAMAVEIVHAAILMHDDFEDSDSVRRGGPTTHKYFQSQGKAGEHYGEAMAVNLGDALWNLGYRILVGSGFESERLIPALEHLFDTIVTTAYGQAFDISLGLMGKFTEKDILEVHRTKTAVYTYENPLMIGALLSGAKEECFAGIREYSMNAGLAFQLQDDILGVFGDSLKTGKSADSDLLQGKCTLLVLKALEKGNDLAVSSLDKVWGRGHATEGDVTAARKAIVESGAYDYSRKLAIGYAKKAADAAAGLRELKLNREAVDYLQGIAEYMVIREV